METIAPATARPNLFKQLVTAGSEFALRKDWYSKDVGHLYLIRIDHRSGKSTVIKDSFLKIGISTQRDVHSRFNLMPQCFHITVIEDIILPLAEVRRLEKEIHRQYRAYQHIPAHKRWGGKTECFKLTLIDTFPSLADIIKGLKEKEQRPDNYNHLQSL